MAALRRELVCWLSGYRRALPAFDGKAIFDVGAVSVFGRLEFGQLQDAVQS